MTHAMSQEMNVIITLLLLSVFVCSMLIILHSFLTSILPIERNIIYYNLHVLITVI